MRLCSSIWAYRMVGRRRRVPLKLRKQGVRGKGRVSVFPRDEGLFLTQGCCLEKQLPATLKLQRDAMAMVDGCRCCPSSEDDSASVECNALALSMDIITH